MLFEEVILTKPASQMYLYHTMKWPLHYDGHPSNNTQTAYCSFIRNGIFSDPSCCVPCSVHNEFLIYLFYGRPVYRWNTFSPFPVLFVFSINATTLPYMIYPFDSGAFGKRYGNAYSSKSLSTYSVYKDGNGISLDKIPSLIEAIWTSQVNYYKGIIPDAKERMTNKQKDNLSVYDNEYLEFIYAGPNKEGEYGSADSRAFTFEVITKQILSFKGLEAIYLPCCVDAKDAIEIKKNFSKQIGHPIKVKVLSGDPTIMFEVIEEEGYNLLKKGGKINAF